MLSLSNTHTHALSLPSFFDRIFNPNKTIAISIDVIIVFKRRCWISRFCRNKIILSNGRVKETEKEEKRHARTNTNTHTHFGNFCITSFLRLGHLHININITQSVAHKLENSEGWKWYYKQTNSTAAMTSIAILKWNKINNRDKYMCVRSLIQIVHVYLSRIDNKEEIPHKNTLQSNYTVCITRYTKYAQDFLYGICMQKH